MPTLLSVVNAQVLGVKWQEITIRFQLKIK